MRNLDTKLRFLRNQSGFVRLAALRCALTYAAPFERSEIAAELLDLAEQPSGPGWDAIEALLDGWSWLDSPTRIAVLDAARLGLPRWLLAMTSGDDPRPRSLAFVIAADVALAMSDPASPVRSNLDSEPMHEALDEALASATADFPSHRNTRVLDAAIALAHAPGPRLGALLNDPMQVAHMPLRTAARNAAKSTPGRCLVAWLAFAALAPVAREAIESLEGEALRDVLEAADLLDSPARAAEAKRMTRCKWFKAHPAVIAQMTERARKGLVRWARTCSVREEVLLHLLDGFASDLSPAVRLEAARTLAARTPSPAADLLLQTYACDPHEEVSLIAARALADAASPARRGSLGAFFRSLHDSPHQRVREIAMEAHEEIPPAAIHSSMCFGTGALA